MALQQSIDQARPQNFAATLARTAEALDHLRAAHRDGKLPLLRLPEKRDDAIATISSGFYGDMSNFILWLNMPSGANRPRQFEAYAREELCGNGGCDDTGGAP